MKFTHTLLLAAATASLALTSCSSEPSDWRPGQKVSVDLVEPGTRADDNFDHSLPNASVENAESPMMQEARDEVNGTDTKSVPSAESAISANAEEGMRKRGKLNDAGKSGQADTAENGHQIQR
ncbi:hypothetical protein [Hymenobacter terricola]|uniref:hypothetical protein n=1 Tax=Hymenobacter terricola TaxID=2819236 RepID=UPI001B31410C|nr:hypothetical protein [Hymenobacter terricola]